MTDRPIQMGDWVKHRSWGPNTPYYYVSRIVGEKILLSEQPGWTEYTYYLSREWVLKGPKIVKKSGFAAFMSKIENENA